MGNLSKNKLIIIIVSSLLVVFISLIAVHFGKPKNLYWSVNQSNTNEVDVYLKGYDTIKVTGFDLKVSLGKNFIQIDSVEPGGFYENPIIVRMDDQNLSYSIITNPINKTSPDLSKPVIKFHLGSSKITDYRFFVLPTSEVYISGKGGAFPRAAALFLK